MDQARDARPPGRGREHRRPGLDRAEDHAHEQLREEQDDERAGDDPSGAVGRRPVGVGEPGRRVDREGGAEPEQQDRRHRHGEAGAREDDEDPDERRAQDERRLVGGALVREGGLHEAGLVRALLTRHRAPAHARERTDLGHRRPRDRGGGDDDGRARAGPGQRDEDEQAHPAGERLDEDDGPLADPVGDGAGDRGARGVGDREGPGGTPAEPVRTGGSGDEQEGAHLAHREREPPDEGDEDVEGAGEREQPPVAGKG